MGGGVQDGGTHVYPWLIHVDVWQKTSHSVVFNALDNSPLLKVLSSIRFHGPICSWVFSGFLVNISLLIDWLFPTIKYVSFSPASEVGVKCGGDLYSF